ncbi:hypothetical protein WJX81_002301 [Elliptochloris bilobata]|uniref:PDZ domain-containing protein n=1 Tax=Elliptochloris bilobata TaxID=381761 RepID=A0AAW1RJL0_9CHLO
MLSTSRPCGQVPALGLGAHTFGRRPQASRLVAHAAEVKEQAAPPATEAGAEEFYEVYLDKPLGVRFSRGNDGGAYIVRSDPNLGSTDPNIEPGDQIVSISASFGTDVWEAKNFGQVMYAIKTRNGQVYMKLKRNFGDLSSFVEQEMSDIEKQFKQERGGGNYGVGTKEKQQANYVARKEAETRRRELFDQALGKFKAGDIEGALIDFEEVISMEPKNYLGDDFSRVTQIYRVAHYNVACCYSVVNQVDAGLEALDTAMSAGFEQFGKIRSDPNLESLRKSPKFKEVIDRYDEPVFNDNAIKVLKSIFSFGKNNSDD